MTEAGDSSLVLAVGTMMEGGWSAKAGFCAVVVLAA